MSEGKLEKLDKTFDSIKSGIVGLLSIALVVVVVIAVINVINKNSQESEDLMPIEEAQKKCVVMEMTDMYRLGDYSNVIKRAQDHCFSLWNTPEKEKEFRSYMKNDWELVKNDVVDGKTLDEYYNELKDSL